MDLDIRHAPGRTIQAVDALSRMPSENKLLIDHPNCKELKRPRWEDPVLNVPVRCPSVSNIFLDAQEAIGREDEVVRELLGERDQNVENAGVTSDKNSTDEDEENQSVADPIQFAFPKLMDDDDDKLC